MISHKHQCIFVHIPKTAGMSIENAFIKSLGMRFQKGQCPPLLLIYNQNTELGPLSLAHLSIKDYLDLNYLNENLFKSYFKFSIVRNPYDRIVSIYKHFQYHRAISFSTFIKKEFPRLEREKYYFIKPQADFILDKDNNSLVNYIGRFEDIEELEGKIKNSLKHPLCKIQHVNMSLKAYNIYSRWNIRYIIRTFKMKPYLLWSLNLKNKTAYQTIDFFNDRILTFINDYYSRDFECFGYKKIDEP